MDPEISGSLKNLKPIRQSSDQNLIGRTHVLIIPNSRWLLSRYDDKIVTNISINQIVIDSILWNYLNYNREDFVCKWDMNPLA